MCNIFCSIEQCAFRQVAGGKKYLALEPAIVHSTLMHLDTDKHRIRRLYPVCCFLGIWIVRENDRKFLSLLIFQYFDLRFSTIIFSKNTCLDVGALNNDSLPPACASVKQVPYIWQTLLLVHDQCNYVEYWSMNHNSRKMHA